MKQIIKASDEARYNKMMKVKATAIRGGVIKI